MKDVELETEVRPTVGATPDGATDEQSASRQVRQMFSDIAPRYDLLNHVLSANVDRLWWWQAARTFRQVLTRPEARVLDLCCGTGDMSFALHKRAGEGGARILGADFAHPMLVRGKQKDEARGSNLRWLEADALHLPLRDASFDLVTAAFGFRNLANYDAGLREIARVLKPGGECGILDFSEPQGIVGVGYRFYFKYVLPTVGGAISGDRKAYEYLPRSVERFPAPAEMVKRMKRAGFARAEWTPYTFGIAGLYRGWK